MKRNIIIVSHEVFGSRSLFRSGHCVLDPVLKRLFQKGSNLLVYVIIIDIAYLTARKRINNEIFFPDFNATAAYSSGT